MRNEPVLESVHTMPLEALRARASEAHRLIAQARAITREAFEGKGRDRTLDQGPDTRPTADAGDEPSRRVGLLLDAAQRLLPGITPLAEARDRPPRSKRRESGWRRVTLRGGEERALASLERASILEELADDAASLLTEIDRGRSSSVLYASEPLSAPPSSERAPRAR